MGKFQYFAVFLALATCHVFLLTHAWQGNKANEPASEKKEDSTVIPKSGVAGLGYSAAAYTNAFRPTTPGNSPGVGHRKFSSEDKDMKAKVVVHSPNVKVYVTKGTTNGFKPTNPGHSPGVGHRKFAPEDMKAKEVVHSPNVKVYVTEGTTNGFKPTNPGHSPGVGHGQQN